MIVRRVLLLVVGCLGLLACLSLSLRVVCPQPATFRGASARVDSVIASPDGKTLASMHRDETLKLWDVTTRKERATLRGSHAAFSPDGAILASAGWKNGTVRLWDVASGKERAALRGHTEGVLTVAFSPDGQTLASGGWDKTIRLWDLTTGKERAILRGHTDSIDSAVFSPDGQTLASGSNDRTVRLWDVTTGKERATLRRLEDSQVIGCGFRGCVAFSPDGKTLASWHWETVKIWDVATGKSIATFEGDDDNDIQRMVFSPDGKTLATLDINDTIIILDIASGNNTVAFEWSGFGFRQPRPRLFRYIQSFLDTHPRITDAFPGIVEERTNVPLSMLFTPDGKLVALGYDAREDGTVKMWQVGAHPRNRLWALCVAVFLFVLARVGLRSIPRRFARRSDTANARRSGSVSGIVARMKSGKLAS